MDPSQLQAVVLIALGYVLGSLPMGVLVAQLTGGTDPRTVGSGRTGGTNALRAMGRGRAILVAALDISKGAVPILIARWAGASDLVGALTGIAALLGAWRSMFLRFSGGRGVATGTGGMLAVSPVIVAVAAPVFVGVIWFSRYVSLGSILSVAAGAAASVVFVLLGWLPWAWLWYTIPGTAIVWIAHRDNIGRLLGGTERRIGSRGGGSATAPG